MFVYCEFFWIVNLQQYLTTISIFSQLKKVLPIIIIAQFFCTSIWFAGNAIMPEIVKQFQQNQDFLAHSISSVQFGFVIGTLCYAILAIADRFSPSTVFYISAIIAALFNLAICIEGINSTVMLLFRFFTGFFLAGIYPVGMKIAADHFQKGLGNSLGFLVGALVLGTAFPHLLKNISSQLPWKYIIYTTSFLSVIGGLIIYLFVPDGPYRKASKTLNIRSFLKAFKNNQFKTAAFGYFGHMWELYAFWTFVPIILLNYKNAHPFSALNIPLLSFLIIASGSLACIIAGELSQKFSSKKIATILLLSSCICCLISPLLLLNSSLPLFLLFLFIWGMTVVGDSPLFSTLVAQNVSEELRGTTLTIVNCIGFAITLISIQLINLLWTKIDVQYIYMLLAIGPIMGLLNLANKRGRSFIKETI